MLRQVPIIQRDQKTGQWISTVAYRDEGPGAALPAHGAPPSGGNVMQLPDMVRPVLTRHDRMAA